MKRAVIFDLDGTLWNATKPIYKALVELQEEKNLPITPFEKLCSLMGQPMDVIAEAVLPGVSTDEQKRLMPLFYLRELEFIRREGGELFPHMVEVLTELKEKYPVLIVSNCQQGYIETFLDTHKLQDLFLDHLCWGDIQQSKGKNIITLMERHGIEEAIYIGDTLGDQKASKEANIPFIYADFGFGEAVNPQHTLSDYQDLPKILQRIWPL